MKKSPRKLPFYDGPALQPPDYLDAKTKAKRAALVDLIKNRDETGRKNIKQFVEACSVNTLLSDLSALDGWLNKRGWFTVSSGEYARNGISLLSDQGFNADREANSTLRALSAKTGISVETYSPHEIEIALTAYDAGIQQAEMIAYRSNAGAPEKVTAEDVEAAFQRFRAKHKSMKPTCALLGKSEYWSLLHKLTDQHYRKWRVKYPHPEEKSP